MRLHELKPAPGSRRPKRIVGRGEGSTLGQTAGKGQKGQKSRSGDGIMNGFEGGQTPLMRRIPKRGFNHPSKVIYTAVNIGELDKKFDAGSEINGEVLFKNGFLKNPRAPFKVLGSGECTKNFKITATRFSKSALAAVAKAGGSLTASRT